MKHSFSGKIIKFLLRQQNNYCGFEQRHFGLNSAELRKKIKNRLYTALRKIKDTLLKSA